MVNVRLLYLMSMLILALPACTSWPWPHVNIYAQGLGESQIADFLKERLICCSPDEKIIAGKVEQMLVNARKNLPPRESAESIGMKCMSPPSTTCGYTGEYRENPDRPVGKLRIVEIFILLPNNEEPSSLVVHTAQRFGQ